MKLRIKMNGIILFLSILAVVFFPHIIIRKTSFAFDDFWEVLGVSLILAGQLLRVSARGYKTEQSGNGASLVVTGPYAMVRNPMYLGIILIGCGVVLAILHLWTLLIFLGGFLLLYHYLFPREEKALSKVFGKDYAAYCSRVPRLFPLPKVIIGRDISSFIPIRLTWFRRELLSIFIILCAVFLIESWEEIRSRGLRFVAPSFAPLAVIILLYSILIIFLAKRYADQTDSGKNKREYSGQATLL